MPPPHKPKELLQLVDTSSQVSIEIAEASLEGIPTSISSIAVTSRSGTVTPPADAMEFWENANKALEELLTTKASIDTHRWRASLGIRYGTLSEQVPSDWIYQGSQSPGFDTQTLRLCALPLSKRPRPPAQQQSKKLRWPEFAPSKRPKLLALQPSGM